MPGVLTCRTLASASRGNRSTVGHAALWPKHGKKLDDSFQTPPQQLTKGGTIVPLHMLPCFQNFDTQPKQRKIIDLFPHILPDLENRGYDGAIKADRSFGDRDKVQEPNSVCLAEMVHGFMESDELCQLCKCGRVRCNCYLSNVNGADHGRKKHSQSNEIELSRIVKDLACDMTAFENLLFAEVIKAMAYAKEQQSKLGSEEFKLTSACFRRAIMKHLIGAGYKAAICKSRWEQTAVNFRGGEYEYMDVIDVSNCSSERVIIDIQFRAQFEIARATDEYNSVLQELPSIFVGNGDRLLQFVNAMCDAMKQSMKKNGMPLPPWRKPEYMKAKWFSSYRRCSKIVSGEHLQNGDKIKLRQALGYQTNLTVAKELPYEKMEAHQELGVNDLNDVFCLHISASARDTIPGENKSVSNEHRKTVMLKDWQPPLVTQSRVIR